MAIKDIFQNIFGTKVHELAKGISIKIEEEKGIPLSIKATPETERVDLAELEQAYISDPICFNSINKETQMIMAAGYEIISKNDGTKNYFIEFFNQIGKVGEDLTLDELFEGIYKGQMIYGSAYVELVFNKSMDRVVDLTLIDSKRMDYAKSSDNKIVLDKFGKPIGYTLKLPWGMTGKSDEIPKEYKNQVSLSQNQIFMLAQRICHFKLYTYGDRFYPLGLIEPAYKSILRKMNIEEAQTNSIYVRGTYPIVVYVGDELHEPTPQSIKEALDNIVKIKHDRYFAFPYYNKVEPVEVKQSDIVQDTLNYLRRNETASLGLPEAFATGGGEATNRATLNNQQQFLEFTLNDIVARTLSTFRKYILKRICFYNGQDIPGNDIPNIKWGDIGAEEFNQKTERLINYVKEGILMPGEVSNFAKKSEGLI